MPTAPLPAESFAAFVRWLTHALITRRLMGLLAGPVADGLIERLRLAKWRIARLAGRVAAGTWRPRRVAARRPPDRPRPNIPRRQKFGWLRPLLPDAVPAAGHLEYLLHDAEIVALMRAAPAPMARILRPLCWMLRVKPPAILAPPRPAAPPDPAPAPIPAGKNPAPARAAAPAVPPPRSRTRARPVPCACGPPQPA